MKKHSLILALVIFALALTGCVNTDDRIVNIATAATTGALYPLGSSISKVWTENLDGVRAYAQASNGGIENLNLLDMKEIEVGFGVTSIVYQSYHGEGPFEGRKNEDIRIIAGLYYNPNQIVVSKKVSGDGVAVLKGLSFAVGAPGSTTEVESRLHMEAAGLVYPDDISPSYIGFTESIDHMRNGSLDGAWIMAGVPNAAVTELITTQGGKLLNVEDEVFDKLRSTYPWYARYTIPADSYDGLDEDVQTTAIKMVMYTHADVDDETVYRLTKAFWENLEEIKAANKGMSSVFIETSMSDLAGVPVHDGAKRYYDEMNIEILP